MLVEFKSVEPSVVSSPLASTPLVSTISSGGVTAPASTAAGSNTPPLASAPAAVVLAPTQARAPSDAGAPPVRTLASDTLIANGSNKATIDTLTRPAEGAARIVVIKSDEPALMLFNGVPDQNFDTGSQVRFQLPPDAFMHTQENAVVRVTAERADGGPLPSWIKFDATSGKFEGRAPTGAPSELTIKVSAQDNEGREASTIFRIKLISGEKHTSLPAGRSGLSDQLRQVGQRSAQMDLLAKVERLARLQAVKRAI